MPLTVQLLASALLAVMAIMIHGTGVVLISQWFTYEETKLKRQRLATRELTLMVPMALCLFVLHVIEITVFALFYLLGGDSNSFERALHVSAMAYSTLGIVEGAIDDWPIVIALEGLVGFLLIGWSAAVFVNDMDEVLRRRD